MPRHVKSDALAIVWREDGHWMRSASTFTDEKDAKAHARVIGARRFKIILASQKRPKPFCTVEDQSRNGVRVIVRRYKSGTTVEATCQCFGNSRRTHSNPTCPRIASSREPTLAEMEKTARTLCVRPWSAQTKADKDYYLMQARTRLMGRWENEPHRAPRAAIAR